MKLLQEIKAAWDSLPGRGPLLALVVAWLCLFHWLGNSVFGFVDTPSLFAWHWAIWNGNEDEEFGMMVPALVAVLFWMKRDEWLAASKRSYAPALVLVAAGLLLHVIGFTVQQTRISALGFLTGLAGILAAVLGPAFLRCTLFPGFLLLFAIPFSGVLDPLTFRLRLLVTAMSVGFCDDFFAMDVIRKGTLIMNRAQTYQFDVAPACSGIRSLMAMFLLTVTYSFLSLASPWRRAIVILAALPFAVLGNVVRLVMVIMVSDAFGQASGAAVETRFGFITFLVGLAGVVFLGSVLRERPARGPKAPAPQPDASESTP